ncbi:MAG: MoaD/ThiS family protein [Ktedonobacteraceae bacterium]
MNTQKSPPITTIILPQMQRSATGNLRVVTVAGNTIRAIIDALDHDYLGIKFQLCYETGELRTFVNLFLNGKNIRYLQALDTPVHENATIHILPSVAGG